MSTRMMKCTCGAVLAAFLLTFGTTAPARASWPDGTLSASGEDGESNTTRLVTYGLLGVVVVVLFAIAWQADRETAGTRSMHARISELEGEQASGGLFGAVRSDALPQGMMMDDRDQASTLEVGWRMTF